MPLTPHEFAELIGRVATAQHAPELHAIAEEMRERWPEDQGTPILLKLIERKLTRLRE